MKKLSNQFERKNIKMTKKELENENAILNKDRKEIYEELIRLRKELRNVKEKNRILNEELSKYPKIRVEREDYP